MKKQIPNIITLLNLFCGCCALVNIFYGNFEMAIYLIMAAAGFDFFDGFAARLLKVSSPVGKELDSLADMVSFGVVPGAILYMLILNNDASNAISDFEWLPTAGFLVTLLSCMRLAKFNLDTRQTDSFIGLPTPAATIFVVGILLVYLNDSFGLAQYITPPVLIGISVVLSILLVSEIPLFALKFKKFAWKGNEVQIIFLVLTLVMLAVLREVAVPLAIVLYVGLSLIVNLRRG